MAYTLQAILENTSDEKPIKGMQGCVSQWLTLTRLLLSGATLQLCQEARLGTQGSVEGESYAIPVDPGDFLVECRAIQFNSDIRIAGLRAFRAGTNDVLRGSKSVDSLYTDIGGIAVVDSDPFVAAIDALDEDDYLEWLEEKLFSTDATTHYESMIKTITWDSPLLSIPVVSAGFGDGTYEVFELYDVSEDNKIVGLEIEFIKDDMTYPL